MRLTPRAAAISVSIRRWPGSRPPLAIGVDEPVGDAVGEAFGAERLEPAVASGASCIDLVYSLLVDEASRGTLLTGRMLASTGGVPTMPISFCRRALLAGRSARRLLAASVRRWPPRPMCRDAAPARRWRAIKERGALRVAAIGEFPWLPENTTGSGPQYSGPAWMLAEEYAKRLGVPLRGGSGQPRDEGADPGHRRCRHQHRPAGGHPEATGGRRLHRLLPVRRSASSARPTIRSCRACKDVDGLNTRRHHHGLLQRHAAGGVGAGPFPEDASSAPSRARAPTPRSRRS